MILPDHVFFIVRALYLKNVALANGDDDARRALQRFIVETVVARFPSEGWGWKTAGQGRPPSKDSIANNKMIAPHLVSFDCFDGVTRAPVQREADIIDGQIFLAVVGYDHLNPASGEPSNPPPSAPPVNRLDRGEFYEALLWLDRLYREQLERVNGVDLEGVAAHIFDVFLNARLAGKSVAVAKQLVVKQINDILHRTDIHV